MALVLRETKGSPLTFEEMDSNLTFLEGKGFPFTGDATIDGTLNIDFTDTLSFFTGDSLNEDFGPLNYTGSFLGEKVTSETTAIFNGIFDGIYDDEVFIGSIQAIRSEFGFSLTNNGVTTGGVQSGVLHIFPDVNTELVGFQHSVGYVSNADVAFDTWSKVNDAFEEVVLGVSSNRTGFVTSNDLVDDTASIHRFENNNAETILDLLNDNLQSDVLLANNFADDAAAAAGDVPEGGFYHTAGVLKIRLPLP